MLSDQPILNNINNSILFTVKAMPSQTGVSDSTGSFSNNRHTFANTFLPTPLPLHKKHYGSHDASSVTERRRVRSVGISLNPNATAIHSDTKHDNSVSDALRRTRAGGAVVSSKVVANRVHSVGVPTNSSHPRLLVRSNYHTPLPLFGEGLKRRIQYI